MDENEKAAQALKEKEAADAAAKAAAENAGGEEDDKDVDGETAEEKAERISQAYKNQKIRAEKAEKELEELKKNNGGKPAEKKPANNSNSKKEDLTSSDVFALVEAKVPQEDVPEVVEYAKFKGITVQDALKSDFVQRTLADKAEKRATANATNVGGQRRGSSKVSDATLLEKASKGDLPESEEEMDRLVQLRIEQKKKRKK